MQTQPTHKRKEKVRFIAYIPTDLQLLPKKIWIKLEHPNLVQNKAKTKGWDTY